MGLTLHVFLMRGTHGYALTSALNCAPSIYELRERFNIYSGIELFNISPNGLEIFQFATKNKENSILDSLLQHFDLLDQYRLYFTSQARDLILQANNSRLPKSNLGVDFSLLDKDSQTITEFLKSIELKSYKINNQSEHISRREWQCLQLLPYCITLKEIANKLNISVRTIEVHLANIKSKLNCSSKRELVDKARTYGLISRFTYFRK